MTIPSYSYIHFCDDHLSTQTTETWYSNVLTTPGWYVYVFSAILMTNRKHIHAPKGETETAIQKHKTSNKSTHKP